MSYIQKIEKYLSDTKELFFWLCEWLHWALGTACVKTLSFLEHYVGRVPWRLRMGIMAALLCAFSINFAFFGDVFFRKMIDTGSWPKVLEVIEQGGLDQAWSRYAHLLAYAGLLLMACAVFFAYWRHRISLALLKIAFTAFGAIWLYFMPAVYQAGFALQELDSEIFNAFARNMMVGRSFLLWLVPMIISLLSLLSVSLRNVTQYYNAGSATASVMQLGDRIIQNLKTHGSDPRFRTSMYWSAWLHVVVLILPFILQGGCLMKPYEIPKGSGAQSIEQVKVQKVKKKVERTLTFNPNSPYIFEQPEIEDSQVTEQVEQQTRDDYKVTGLKSAKLGQGGGDEGGWPDGMEDARVRFIRLKYKGGDWNQDMGKLADYNFLIKFRELTGFNIWKKTEAIKIRSLARFPKDRAPPFVFITGSGGIHVSTKEVRVLRNYLLKEGGMLFADNGGGRFNHSFRNLMNRVLPGKAFVDISNDDIIYQRPYQFPNGAPPLWAHSGERALGIKHNGRWVVFYHQGDINDAWKAKHSGARELAPQAYRLGVNVVNYAFNNYLRLHFGDQSKK